MCRKIKSLARKTKVLKAKNWDSSFNDKQISKSF